MGTLFVDSLNWLTYESDSEHNVWLVDSPYPEMQAGGPPRRRKLVCGPELGNSFVELLGALERYSKELHLDKLAMAQVSAIGLIAQALASDSSEIKGVAKALPAIHDPFTPGPWSATIGPSWQKFTSLVRNAT